jgi:tRNA (guanine37-N1)-methyltransferase
MIESYALSDDMSTIEFPQYTRPEEVLGMRVPDVLLSGHHQKIQEWRDENLTKCN